jgi:hypothetical protein
MQRRPSTIVIIDGSFQNKPTVWHKEILFALSRGVRVVGCSSMGALRAAELHVFGMEGTGAIYEAFRDGVYNDDDEVAVTHAAAEHGFRALSEAMVNIRAALAEAERRRLISAPTGAALVAGAKRLFYPNRSWPALFGIGRDQGLPVEEMAALQSYVRSEHPNQKREDAVVLLRQLAGSEAAAPPGPPPSFTFESSWFWKKLVATEERRRDALAPCGQPPEIVHHAAVARHVRFASLDREELLRSALLLHLIERQAASQSSHDVADETPTARLERFGKEIAAARSADVDRYLSVELRRRGLFDDVVKEIESRWQRLRESGILTEADLDAAEIDQDQLLAWLAGRLGRSAPVDLELLAVELGFASIEELKREATAAYLVENLVEKREGAPGSK